MELTHPVARHFSEAKHSWIDYSFIGIDKVNVGSRGVDIKKSFWIYKLRRVLSRGMNEDFSY